MMELNPREIERARSNRFSKRKDWNKQAWPNLIYMRLNKHGQIESQKR